MSDDLGMGATAAQQQSMEIPTIPGLGGIMGNIPGMGPGEVTPQPHVTMPPVPKPLMHENNPGWQNTSGKPLSRGGEKKANKYNAIAAAGNMIGKFTNKQKEDKYNAIQYDLQRVLEAAQIANDPSMPPEVRKHNEAIVQATMQGKHGKEIQKIFGDMNPFGDAKDARGQQALTKANQSVQQKNDAKQMIMQKLQSAQPQATPPIQPPMAAPSIPGAPAPMMNGAPVSGAAASIMSGPQGIKPAMPVTPGTVQNPSAGSSVASAAAPASQTPMSDKLMSMFPTMPGLSKSAQLQAQMMKEFQPMIVEQMKMATELARVQGNLSAIDARMKAAVYEGYLKHLEAVDLEGLRQNGKMSLAEYKFNNALKLASQKHAMAMGEIKATQKAQLLMDAKTIAQTEYGDLGRQIKASDDKALIDKHYGDAIKNPNSPEGKAYLGLKNQQELLGQQLEKINKSVTDLTKSSTGYDVSKVTTDELVNRPAGILNDNTGSASVYGVPSGAGSGNSNSFSQTDDPEEDDDF